MASSAHDPAGYEPPSIIKLGSFVELTQGGTPGTKKDKVTNST